MVTDLTRHNSKDKHFQKCS